MQAWWGRGRVLVLLLLLGGCAILQPDAVEEPERADAVLATRVKAQLIEDGTLDAAAIFVEADGASVHLSGYVETEAQRQRALALTRAVEGVNVVSDDIEVKQ